MKLYKRIKARREELNMSQEELAKLIGYKSRSSINKIEIGENDIPQSKIKAFADALQTTPAYLMGWDEDGNSSLPKPQKDERDLAKFLDRTDLLFDGAPLTDEDREKVRKALEIVFWDAKDENKKAYAKRKNAKTSDI